MCYNIYIIKLDEIYNTNKKDFYDSIHTTAQGSDSISKIMYDELLKINKNFGIKDALKIKDIEKITNHDVKAVEYFLKDKFDKHKTLKNKKELIHFCATSEDINNISYALMFNESRALISKDVEL